MDIDALAEAWRQRAARGRTERLERAARARENARRAAAVLRDEFGADEVWLFGSLSAAPVHDDFDIDLAVRGIRPADYFAALARACEVAGGPVDLVLLESGSERIRQVVESAGVRIDHG